MGFTFDKTPLSGGINNYEGKIRFHKVDETQWEVFWDDLVREYHYLGYESVIGARVKYVISFGKQIVGAISFCSAAYHLGPRDEFIGWDEETRVSLLPHLVCNNRFLILPWINIQNLASHILSLSLRQLQTDWEEQYGVKPYMAETFVDNAHYLGTCYKAANWTYLGTTKGYGRLGKTFVYHGQRKDIYVYVIDRSFAKKFKPDAGRLYDEREELAGMINGIPMWAPSLLERIGITENIVQEIKERFTDFLARYVKHLGRKEHKEHLVAMEQGLLSDLDRKSIEPIAVAFEGVDCVRNLTHFMSDSKWDDEGMMHEYQDDLSGTLSHEDAMITGDVTDMPKKGKHSVGVARQYCGRLGKVDNCQSSVMMGYASPLGYGLVDRRLYLPESWFNDDHAKLRKKCGVPTGIEFKTKNDMLQEMICEAVESGKFPAKYVGVDCAFGTDTKFLDSLPESITYFADVRHNQLVFDGRPEVAIPAYSGKGRKPTKQVPEFEPRKVSEIAEDSKYAWNDVVLGIGAKGPIITQDKCIRVVEVRDGLPGKDVWLYIRKLENGDIKYALCNAPPDAPIEAIRKPALMRWSIEQCFNECKDYLGMDHYEARSWNAWHRHTLFTFMAHLFIIKQRIAFSIRPQSPNIAPYIETPVSLKDYLDASVQLESKQEISHPDIFAMPIMPQQIMTIGLVQKLIVAAFVKVGELLKEIDYYLYTSASAFDSHSKTKLKEARIAFANSS